MVEDSGPPLSGQPRAAVLHGLNRGFEPFFGMNEKDLRVNYEDGLLTVSGERSFERTTATITASSAATARLSAASLFRTAMAFRRSRS